MLDRIINIFFIFALVFIFILFAKQADHIRIFIALGLSFVCVILAFMVNWLTLDGAIAALSFGVIAYGLGDLSGAAVVLAFFISSSILSKDLISEEAFLDKKFRRDGLQVWSNGFWFALWIMVWFLSEEPAFLVAAVASMAFSNADTWASEVGGHRVKGKTVLITSFKQVKPGTDGGISLVGTLATMGGAVFIAGVFWVTNLEIGAYTILLIAISGFVGSLIDSWLGAKVQGKRMNRFFRNLFARQISYVDNNMVNWIAAGSASVMALSVLLFTGL